MRMMPSEAHRVVMPFSKRALGRLAFLVIIALEAPLRMSTS